MLGSLKPLFQRVLEKKGTILKDLKLILRHSLTIPNIYLPLTPNSDTVKSELNPSSYTNELDWVENIYQAIVPRKRHSISEGNLICYPETFVQEEKSSKWFFVNGMLTAPQTACLNTKELARIFGRPVSLIHTPTDGFMGDLFDSFVARTLQKDGQLSQPAYRVIKKSLQTYDHLVLICHSQGTIVSSYIVRKLQKDPDTRKLLHKLELYSFAGVADSFRLDLEESQAHNRPVPYIEHFVNTKDFFARIGILAHHKSTEGPIFASDSSGHFLNAHYLSKFMKGDYCRGQSRLFQYLGGKSPNEGNYVRLTKAKD